MDAQTLISVVLALLILAWLIYYHVKHTKRK